MTLSIYNTLTRRQEQFTTVEPGKVKMYYCGVTVYDYCHLGHARACIVWDVVRRYLQFIGYDVRYIQNFTDIDDKILKRAREENSSMEVVAEKYIQAYFEDMSRLGIKEADEYPRATHTMNGIQKLIHDLEHKGFAYPSGGDVYYAVQNFAEYGKLSGRKLEDMQAGASERVNIEDTEYQKKKYPFDFALWKAAKSGEPAWESPWGKGRPGWHIECSAMVRDRLGDTIDIHAGGADLIFPHHENEIAQSEAVTGKPLANYWLHNGMVKVDGEKMSKSLGNFITIRQLLDRGVDPMAVRLFVMMAQYRKPIDFTDDAILAATNGWHTIKEGLLFGHQHSKKLGWDESKLIQNSKSKIQNSEIERFKEAVNDDFNFPGGLTIIFELAKELNREGNIIVHQGRTETPADELLKKWQTLITLAEVLGLTAKPEPETSQQDSLSDIYIEELIQQRQEARKNKNFAESDRIRNELLTKGITLIDSKESTRWHRN
ncbi:cysteine--tRNA ligase [Aphanizomenon flos-aquae NRERC-008]|jgi:cysteinyl-tRNA synthetase|uniref:Cysteine--tRNA ligase n=1 Tax=Aphanizomenon flos-aquae FACHB-1249 TaxID=2692889 RepID=A0ABR8ITZ1_APHFL|nr:MULTISPECIES: cysteine--tRNA ligase [Aphanizomenon]MCE2903629.1 cysteine--tRNA ligase [Anabaena sp. CoA2_C59]MDJ0504923.1 cysteine--tRNA ligase [Nostocales cyanobacterium LE14-WE12]MBD2390631.1 cysteine--tRNA ligase [Aphanizomenon flos-aquae FACHB-1171]MBD2557606.1 cysteine--tRNA ligase [Aphanizomenon flos-aquae FACHB-1290]MBD2632043.1 cysteine--tRNA ligase [Aphanizomenon sp. FACHB-1399]